MARAARARSAAARARLQRRWAITLWPTAAAAQQAGMGTRDFEAFVERALFLDRDDPVAAWGELRDVPGRADRAARARRSEIRIEAEGTDLTLDGRGRTWINSDGKRNMPSRRGLHRPARALRRRRDPLHDPDLAARRGRRGRDARVPRGPRRLRAAPSAATPTCRPTLETDDGARYLGELGIGTNFGIDRPIGAILFDEKIGGTVHLALGRSYPETGGTNESACTGT